MTFPQRVLRTGFERAEAWLDRAFGPAWNPLHSLGALGFFYFWVVAISGIYLYIFFDTGTTAAYASLESITRDQWYLGGVMRSLHRYASDGLALMAMVHLLREFAMDRLHGPRWFTWVTGVPILGLVIVSGITGYWLVWDMLAQFIAVETTEWLDWLGIFGEPIARNFLSPARLDDRFFSLMMFIHIAVPLILLFLLWIHLQRVSRPRINPSRGLAVGTFLMLLALAFVHPAESQAPADLTRVPTLVGLDWFYLAAYPLMELWSDGAVWAFAVATGLMLFALPWLPPRREPAAAVDLGNCNGCGRCAEDCPYNAVAMGLRTDGLPFLHQAVVDPDLCVSCGICAGACPTGTPFRRGSDLVAGIDLPHRNLRDLRERVQAASARLTEGPRVIVFGCDSAAPVARLEGPQVAAVSLPCIAALPPSFVDYVLSRDLAEGVFLTGCREGDCFNRFGIAWTEARLAGERDPRLRARVPRERLRRRWAARSDLRRLDREIAAFREHLRDLPAAPAAPPASAAPAARQDEAVS